MAEKWFEKMRSEIKDFISNASNDEFDNAFEKANYNFYKDIKTPIFWLNEMGTAFEFESSFTIKVQSCTLSYTSRERNFSVDTRSSDDYLSFDYLVAA